MTHTEPPAPSLTNTNCYGTGAIAFHWAAALLVIGVGVLGLLHDTWPKRTQAYWINVHALTGLVLWTLVIARYGWRLAHPPPSLPANMGAFDRRLSLAAHLTMYALLFITPIIGIVTFIWHGRVFNFGLFQVDFGIARNRAVFAPTEDLHGYLAYGLFGVAAVHILAALWHHFVRRDGFLRRMWPAPAVGTRDP